MSYRQLWHNFCHIVIWYHISCYHLSSVTLTIKVSIKKCKNDKHDKKNVYLTRKFCYTDISDTHFVICYIFRSTICYLTSSHLLFVTVIHKVSLKHLSSVRCQLTNWIYWQMAKSEISGKVSIHFWILAKMTLWHEKYKKVSNVNKTYWT